MNAFEAKLLIDDYRNAVRTAALAATMLQHIDFTMLIRAIDDAHAVGPILEPTLYREKCQAMGEDRALLVAAQSLAGALKRRAPIEAIKAQLRGDSDV